MRAGSGATSNPLRKAHGRHRSEWIRELVSPLGESPVNKIRSFGCQTKISARTDFKDVFGPLSNPPEGDPDQSELPMVRAARERDRLARAALKAGKSLATAEDELELRAWSGRGGRR